MSFVRVTYVVPREGQVKRVSEQLKKLSDYYATQPGYIEGYLLNPHPMANPPAMGRFGVWESDKAAEDAAQSQHAMALRAELLRLVDEDSHLELTFEGDRDANAK
jgi:heme-degrading monooxygenase HmoA